MRFFACCGGGKGGGGVNDTVETPVRRKEPREPNLGFGKAGAFIISSEGLI